MIIASKLKKGECIGLVSPCYIAPPGSYDAAIAALRDMGYRVKVGGNMYKNTYGYAASEKERAEDINEMVHDRDVRMVLFGGGEVGVEVLPYLDFAAMRNDPKLYLSYSDGTSILNAITSNTDIVTYYGQTPGIFAYMAEYDRARFAENIVGPGVARHIGNSEFRALMRGAGEGRLVGGFLLNFALMLGSPYFSYDENADYLLFLEDSDKFIGVDAVSSLLSNIEQHPFMKRVRGLIFGNYNDDVPETLLARLARFGGGHIPVAYCDDFGHGKNHAILPIGAMARLDTTEKSLTYKYTD